MHILAGMALQLFHLINIVHNINADPIPDIGNPSNQGE